MGTKLKPKNRQERRHGVALTPPPMPKATYTLTELKRVKSFRFGGPPQQAHVNSMLPNLPKLPPESAVRPPSYAEQEKREAAGKPPVSGGPGRMEIHYPCSMAIVLNLTTGEETRITYTHTAKGFVGKVADKIPGSGDPTYTIHAAFGHTRKLSRIEFAKVAEQRYNMPRLPELLVDASEWQE